MQKNIYLFSNYYPFGQGEVFLENEVKYALSNGIELKIFPIKNSLNKNIRDIERKHFSDLFLKFSLKNQLYAVFNSFKYVLKIKQAKYRPQSLKQWKNALGYIYRSLLFYTKLIENKEKFDREALYYSYWFDFATFALALAKNKDSHFKDIKIVCRSHGYDCFEEIRKIYFPFREYVLTSLENVFVASEVGTKYLGNRYPEFKEKIKISHLGVFNQHFDGKIKTENNKIKIISCSNIVPVKRVELIVEMIQKYAQNNSYKNIEWTHVGSGFLFENLKKISADAQKQANNLKINILGSLSNDNLLKLYRDNYYDFFISFSLSEATPVSINEAMSFAIPSIATDAGGTRETIIDGHTGVLLPINFSYQGFEKAIESILENRDSYSQKALEHQRKYFDNNKNLYAFYNNLQQI